MPWWQKADAPVFVALGGGDTNVPVEDSVRRFEELSRVPLIRVYPDGGHAISDPATGRVQQALLNDLVEFLHQSLRWPLTRNSDG
jgi:dipeptidyl aminopeptidase/acylaminoacyl peptidase